MCCVTPYLGSRLSLTNPLRYEEHSFLSAVFFGIRVFGVLLSMLSRQCNRGTKLLQIKRALLSVSNKDGIVSLAKFLASKNVELISTGGTAKKLKDAGLEITPIEQVTGNPEAFAGRMKTLSFQISSSLLYRRGDADDEKQAKELGIEPIDLVVCNLYPFAEARARGADDAELIEEIDIGGPTMIRATAKNYTGLAVLTRPDQYAIAMDEMEQQGGLTLETRKKFSAQAFQMTAQYDSMIAEELSARFLGEPAKYFAFHQGKELRYGENPHQKATFYRDMNSKTPYIAGADILQGKALSYNNLVDADAAHRAMSDAFHAVNDKNKFAVCVVKHMNPCGLAVAGDCQQALELAWAGDPVSAFGGILAFSGEITLQAAEWLSDKFIEVLIAPSIDGEALKLFAKKKNLRILIAGVREEITGEQIFKTVSGGLLVQDEDEGLNEELQTVTKAKLPVEEDAFLRFGVASGKHLKSNAISLVIKTKDGAYQQVGAGMGQPNRIDSLRMLAAPRAAKYVEEKLLVSDAFFPFADTIDVAHECGIKAILQPGGSIRDKEVIDACDKYGIAMAFTGRRHFRH